MGTSPLPGLGQLLKVGLIRGGAEISQVWFGEGMVVTVGRDPSSTFPLEGPETPTRHELFSLRDGTCLIQLRDTMEMRLDYQGSGRDLTWLADHGLAWKRGRHTYVKLGLGARGFVRIGGSRLLFKVLLYDGPPPLEILLERLPPPPFVSCQVCGEAISMGSGLSGSIVRCSACRTFHQLISPSASPAEGRSLPLRSPPSFSAGNSGIPSSPSITADTLPADWTTTSVGSTLFATASTGTEETGEKGRDPAPPPLPDPLLESRATRLERNPLLAKDGRPRETRQEGRGNVIPMEGQGPVRRSRGGGGVPQAQVLPFPPQESAPEVPETLALAAPPPRNRRDLPSAAPTPSPSIARSLNLLVLVLLLVAALLVGILLTLILQDRRHATRPPSPAEVPPASILPSSSPPSRPSSSSASMVEIPGGAYQKTLPGDDHPVAVHVQAFAIDSTEVTRGAYSRFVEATSHPPPLDWNGGRPRADELDFPVTGVSAADAAAYCAFVGARLPEEKEWEKAAAGVEGRNWPWGDVFDEARFASGLSPAAVGSHPQSDSPYGVHDLAGNAAEWVDPGPGNRAFLKGGSAGAARGPEHTLIWARLFPEAPAAAGVWAGFRCARSVGEAGR